MTKPGAEKESHIRSLLKMLPDDPGIYRYFDEKGNILYIGKAKNLKNRVRSYFTGKKGHSYRIALMVDQIADIQWTITHSEVEALTLENNLIKEYQPKYNIMLKDGKTYPYICIKNEPFPRIFPTRNRRDDGSQYFGPYTSVTTMNSILALIRQNFKLRTCNYVLSRENIEAGKFKLCLEYQIGNCGGPCTGLVSNAEYDANVDLIRKILSGHLKPILETLEADMQSAAAEYRFEAAEEIRQRMEHIRAYKRRNTVISENVTDVEVLTADRLNDLSVINYFKVISGAIVRTHTWEYRRRHDETDEEILSAVFSSMLAEREDLGRTLLSNVSFEAESAHGEIEVKVPRRGDKQKLVELSMKNCRMLLEEKVWKQNFQKRSPQERVLEQLQSDLGLNSLPKHIECFDNSNFQGTNPVASMVVFRDGKPAKKDYRHFKIKTVEGPDDFRSMQEIVFRRYKRLLEEEQPLPDLVIVDGGKGQLSSAVKSLRDLDLFGKLPIIGIAKKLEEIYKPGDPLPLHLDKRSTSLKLIQQLRNEAHRFAITFHRQLRSKQTNRTRLTELEGIGEKTAKKLLRHFRSMKKLLEASEEEIAGVIGPAKAAMLAEKIRNKDI